MGLASFLVDRCDVGRKATAKGPSAAGLATFPPADGDRDVPCCARPSAGSTRDAEAGRRASSRGWSVGLAADPRVRAGDRITVTRIAGAALDAGLGLQCLGPARPSPLFAGEVLWVVDAELSG